MNKQRSARNLAQRLWLAAFGTALLVLTACGADTSLKPLAADAVILAFGDSLTVGVGATPDRSYPAMLSEITGRRVVSAGVSGEVTRDGLTRLPAVLDASRPALMILLEGGNDILRNRKQAEIKSNLAEMISMAQSRGIDVLLLGVPEKKLFSDAAPLYAELAEQFGLVYEDELLAGLIRSPSLKSDAVHLNAAGYRKLAEGVADLLKRRGALN